MVTFDEEESSQIQEETEKIINDIKRKILPSLEKRKPRTVFRPKRIKLIFESPINQFLVDREKITFDLPQQEQIDFVASTNMPIFFIMEELTVIENRLGSRQLKRLR